MKISVSMPRLTSDERSVMIALFAEEAAAVLGLAKKAIKISVNVRKTVLEADTLGNCRNRGEAKAFTIVLGADHDARTTLVTLAHELIHVEQAVAGKMAKWAAVTPAGTPWRELPWERDALGRELEVAKAAARGMVKATPQIAKIPSFRFGGMATEIKRLADAPFHADLSAVK
jgi:hypothetical protein